MTLRELESALWETSERDEARVGGLFGPGECERCERPCASGEPYCRDCRADQADREVRILEAAEALRSAERKRRVA